MKKTMIIAALLLASTSLSAGALCQTRYFFSGDGKINIVGAKNGISFNGTYRLADGTYDPSAMKRIHSVFSANYGSNVSEISTRFIEYLDYIQDHYNPKAKITIISGYRSPSYNTGLRNKGRLAAKASLHQYGMAADIKIDGVRAENLWHFIRDNNLGGAGYYHGASVHVDSGPARFWDETTSGVGTDISDDNKLIEVVMDKDIYKPGERVKMRLTRATLFPVSSSPSFRLEELSRSDKWKLKKTIRAKFPNNSDEECVSMKNIDEMTGISMDLPEKTPPGRYRISAEFCGEMPESMPAIKESAIFEIR